MVTGTEKKEKAVLAAILCGILLLMGGVLFWHMRLQGFSIAATNGQGERIYPFCAEDKTWHLFLPPSWDPEEVILRGEGAWILDADAGKLDKKTGTVTSAFSAPGDTVSLFLSNGWGAPLTVERSNLPSLQIRLNGTTLDMIRKDKNITYPNNAAVLALPDGTETDLSGNPCKIKGRGNSSWNYFDKKGFQLRFAEKVSFLGMAPATDWILLANASDDSMMCNKLVYDLGEKIYSGYVPHFEYIDLWIDGEYQGLYLIGEKVEIDPSRLDLREKNAVLMELDNVFYLNESARFTDDLLGDTFTLKDTNTDSLTALGSFRRKLTELYTFLFSASSDQLTDEALRQYLDVDSFAFSFLMSCYWKNVEAVSSSDFFWIDGESDVIHAGPIWDYDTCAGNDGFAGDYEPIISYCPYSHLLASPDFLARVEKLYSDNRELFEALPEECARLYDQIALSAEQNYLRRPTLGIQNPKAPEGFCMAHSFEEAVASLSCWLEKRSETFTLRAPSRICWDAEPGSRTVTLICGEAAVGGVNFAVWSDENGQDDLIWYPAEPCPDGWECRIDLTEHLTSGKLVVHVYEAVTDRCISIGNYYILKG